MKKKKTIIISISIIIIVAIILLIMMFINNLNEDKKIVEKNINIINDSYEKLKEEVANYNDLREDMSLFINNFYYDTIEEKYSDNLVILNSYDEVVNKITNEIKILDSKCDNVYSDEAINNICNNYKNDYETIVNIFINDINNYNNKLESYNKDNSKNLELFKSNYINDYIDYNNDNIYSEKDEVND